MMEFSDIIQGIPKDKFKATANKLLNECFIIKQSKETASDYNIILNHRESFIQYFDFLGYEVIINEGDGVITLNNPSGTGRIHLKKVESILLLIIRVLYIEKKRTLSELNDVIVLADEIYDKYNLMKFRSRLDKTTMRNAMGLFKRYHLISNLDKDMSDPNTRIKIWPSILFAVTTESINEMYTLAQNKLEKYADEGDKNDDADAADDEEINSD